MSLIDYEIDERFLQSHTLSFKVPATDLKTMHLVEDALLELQPGEYFYITEVRRIRDNERADYEVLAEARWMKLADLKRPGNFTLTAVTAAAGLTAILEGTNWNTLQVTSDVTTHSMDVTDATVLDLIWTWAKICQCEVSFEGAARNINFITTVGGAKPLAFRYGRNLTQIKRTSKAPSVTRLYVYGRDDIDITGLTTGGVPYIEDYTYYTDQGMALIDAQTNYRKDDIYSDDSFLDSNSLYNAGVARLATLAQPSVLYECSVIDLSALTNSPDYDFRPGDRVRVYDGVLDIDIEARVTRKVSHPYEPEKNIIELSFGDVLLPDPNVSSSRSDASTNWELFESHNSATIKQVRSFSQILHRIRLETVENAEWIINFKLKGVGVNSSIVTLTATDDETGLAFWSTFTETISNGQAVDLNFSFGQKEIPAGVHTFSIRAISNTTGAGINIPLLGTAFWVLARGTTRDDVTLPNSVRFDYTGALQNWLVPDGVFEILVEAVGGSGSNPTDGGRGGQVIAKFPVAPVTRYDVYVGGYSHASGSNTAGGWPDGGDGDTVGGSLNTGAGSSTQLRLAGDVITNALIIAPGGGGAGEPDNFSIPPNTKAGGNGGFYAATAGASNGVVGAAQAGLGATQDDPGIGGAGPAAGENGDVDGVGQGGDAGDTTNFFSYPSGGGGGGWHGGGGGAGLLGSLGAGGGGGGGSGKLGPTGFDLEYTDAFNPPATDGYMIISWETPADP